MDIGNILNGGPEPEWYTVPGTEAKVQIRNPKPSRRREIVRQATRTRMSRGQRVEILDNDKLNLLLLDECVRSWKNIEQDGEELECTMENKRLLDENWDKFNALWNAVVGSLGTMEDALEEAERGNL